MGDHRSPRLLEPLRHRDFRLLAIGSLISLFGDGLFIASIALQVYALSDAPTALAVVGVIVATAQLTLLLAGGWASDRLQRRQVMIAADLVRCAAIGGLGVLSVTGRLEIWHIWVLIAFHGAGNAFFNPAATAFVPDLLPDRHLAQANAFLGTAKPLMHRLLGPAAGGFVVAAWGAGASFLIDAVTFLISAAMLARIGFRSRPDAVGGGGPEVGGLGAGFRFVRTHAWCWAWLVGAALSILAMQGPFEVLVPYLLRFDPQLGLTEAQAARLFGLILAAGGLGSICVAIAVGQLDLPRRFVTVMYLAEAVGVGLLVVYGFMTSVWHALVASLIAHAMFAFTDIAWTTLLQRRTPASLLGRVSSIDWLTSLGLVPLSFGVAGPLAERFGAREVLVGGGILGATVLCGLLFVPGARAPERAADRVATAQDRPRLTPSTTPRRARSAVSDPVVPTRPAPTAGRGSPQRVRGGSRPRGT